MSAAEALAEALVGAAFEVDFAGAGLLAAIGLLTAGAVLGAAAVVLVEPLFAAGVELGADMAFGEAMELSALVFFLWLLLDVVVAVESVGAAVEAPAAAGAAVPAAAEPSLAADFLLFELFFVESVLEVSAAAASVEAVASVPAAFLECDFLVEVVVAAVVSVVDPGAAA